MGTESELYKYIIEIQNQKSVIVITVLTVIKVFELTVIQKEYS